MTAVRIVRVLMRNGFTSVKAAPTPTPGLVVSEDPVMPGGWNITHLASGCTIASHFEDPEHALYLAVQLGPVCDWTLPATELRKLLPGLRQKWQRVLEEAGALDKRPTGMAPSAARLAAMEPLS